MTREEVLQLAREVNDWKARSYVKAARLFAAWILEVADVEHHQQLAEIKHLHNRCSELLESNHELRNEIARLERAELPTEKRLRK